MHEEAIPMLRVGDAAVSSESTPTISQAAVASSLKPC